MKLVGVVAVAALSAVAAYLLFLKSKKKDEEEQESQTENKTYKSNNDDSTNSPTKTANENNEPSTIDNDKIDDVHMSSKDEVNDENTLDSMTSSVPFEMLDQPDSMEIISQSKSLITENTKTNTSLIDIKNQTLEHSISMDESYVDVSNEIEDLKVDDTVTSVSVQEIKDVSTFEDKHDFPLKSKDEEDIKTTNHNFFVEEVGSKGDVEDKKKEEIVLKPELAPDVLNQSEEPKEAVTDDDIPEVSKTSSNSSEKEDIEVIDLVTDEDNEDKQQENVKDDSVIICEDVENKRITRGALNASIKSESSNDEIVLLKEDNKQTGESKLLEESDFTDDDDDFSDDDSSVESVETEITLDLDKSESAEVTKQENDDEKKTSSSNNDVDSASDKLNESLKIDLRPSWQVRNRKSSLVKSGQESTASI